MSRAAWPRWAQFPVATVLLGLLSACGGNGASTALQPGPEVTEPQCPADPTTFVGPLPVQCLPPKPASTPVNGGGSTR